MRESASRVSPVRGGIVCTAVVCPPAQRRRSHSQSSSFSLSRPSLPRSSPVDDMGGGRAARSDSWSRQQPSSVVFYGKTQTLRGRVTSPDSHGPIPSRLLRVPEGPRRAHHAPGAPRMQRAQKRQRYRPVSRASTTLWPAGVRSVSAASGITPPGSPARIQSISRR